MASEEEWKPWKHPYRAQTIIIDSDTQEQIAWLDAPVWLPDGAIIELGNPNRDAIVLGSRLAIPTGTSDDLATIQILVSDGKLGDFVPRDPTARLLKWFLGRGPFSA